MEYRNLREYREVKENPIQSGEPTSEDGKATAEGTVPGLRMKILGETGIRGKEVK